MTTLVWRSGWIRLFVLFLALSSLVTASSTATARQMEQQNRPRRGTGPVRIDNLTLEELTKKLEEQGYAKEAIEQIIQSEKERRGESSAAPAQIGSYTQSSGVVSPQGTAGPYYIGCPTGYWCWVKWSGVGSTASRWYDSNAIGWTGWSPWVACLGPTGSVCV